MPVLLLLLLATIVEITVLVMVGQAIGILPTIGLLILASVVGVWLLRREGARTFAGYQDAMRAGRIPHRELIDGVVIAGAGLLVLVPGFVSDLLALALLFPPTRAVLTRRIVRRAELRARRGPARRTDGAFVVDSVVVDPGDPVTGAGSPRNDEIDRRP